MTILDLLTDLSKGTSGPCDEHPQTGRPSDLLTPLLTGGSVRKSGPVFGPFEPKTKNRQKSWRSPQKRRSHEWAAASAS